MEEEVIVIGAGMAGLAAADALSAEGVSVLLIEARSRAGGRIHTLASSDSLITIELGAEFIHGARNTVWDLVRGFRLQTREVPDRHWQVAGDRIVEQTRFREKLSRLLRQTEHAAADIDVRQWLSECVELDPDLRQMLWNYVEGFHAAPAERMSLRALAIAETESSDPEATRSFRIHEGYGRLVHCLTARLVSQRAGMVFNTEARTVRWEPGAVRVEALSRDGLRAFTAAAAIVTLPLGVLKENSRGVAFEPVLEEKERAIRAMGMGHAMKLSLQFHERFWPAGNMGFIHSDHEWLPTWWEGESGAVLTGWAAGPRAEWLNQEDDGAVLSEAFSALSRIFKVNQDDLADLLVNSYRHNWSNDPFSRGAYSYTPVGTLEMSGRLAEPVADTLFFAGEATSSPGEQGTVQGAVASGVRAARQVLRAVPLSR